MLMQVSFQRTFSILLIKYFVKLMLYDKIRKCSLSSKIIAYQFCSLPQMLADGRYEVRTRPPKLPSVGLVWGCFLKMEREKGCHIKI